MYSADVSGSIHMNTRLSVRGHENPEQLYFQEIFTFYDT